jgi:heme exporter protein CcmD
MFGSYGSFIVTSYLLVTLAVAILIAWIVVDYRLQKRRLQELQESGVGRLSGRSATEI